MSLEQKKSPGTLKMIVWLLRAFLLLLVSGGNLRLAQAQSSVVPNRGVERTFAPLYDDDKCTLLIGAAHLPINLYASGANNSPYVDTVSSLYIRADRMIDTMLFTGQAFEALPANGVPASGLALTAFITRPYLSHHLHPSLLLANTEVGKKYWGGVHLQDSDIPSLVVNKGEVQGSCFKPLIIGWTKNGWSFSRTLSQSFGYSLRCYTSGTAHETKRALRSTASALTKSTGNYPLRLVKLPPGAQTLAGGQYASSHEDGQGVIFKGNPHSINLSTLSTSSHVHENIAIQMSISGMVLSKNGASFAIPQTSGLIHQGLSEMLRQDRIRKTGNQIPALMQGQTGELSIRFPAVPAGSLTWGTGDVMYIQMFNPQTKSSAGLPAFALTRDSVGAITYPLALPGGRLADRYRGMMSAAVIWDGMR